MGQRVIGTEIAQMFHLLWARQISAKNYPKLLRLLKLVGSCADWNLKDPESQRLIKKTCTHAWQCGQT